MSHPLSSEIHSTVRFLASFPIERMPEHTDRKVRRSNQTCASRLLPSRPEQPGSIPALILPSVSTVAIRWKGSTRAEILPGYASQDRSSRDPKVGVESRTLRSVSSRFNLSPIPSSTCCRLDVVVSVVMAGTSYHKVHPAKKAKEEQSDQEQRDPAQRIIVPQGGLRVKSYCPLR
ncbi:hypothetical protein T265_11873 [Opisthorchis viverrini]|uniref:Uncharacterized protein n=1 Tax=Opisthorchis viverrini TaxID=6198 RepID=A0A074Z7U8_OPIVI|nr:hypothetical protein T265_11873 [Opisthorchis viverrini]KER19315.1 hypothetical protein T265_11873 [Opisthorchis viverrini]